MVNKYFIEFIFLKPKTSRQLIHSIFNYKTEIQYTMLVYSSLFTSAETPDYLSNASNLNHFRTETENEILD